MADRRPRNQRPRSRGGKGRLSDLAAVERQQQSALELKNVLLPEVEALPSESRKDVVDRIRARANELAAERGDTDPEPVVEAALDEIFGLGPLEPLLRDTTIRAIRLDGVHLFADGTPVDWGFRDDEHARSVIDRVLRAVGEDLASSPDGVQVSMMDGSSLRARLLGPILQVHIARP